MLILRHLRAIFPDITLLKEIARIGNAHRKRDSEIAATSTLFVLRGRSHLGDYNTLPNNSRLGIITKLRTAH